MDDLIKQLQEQTGLGADKIKQVIAGVSDYLGDKLPGPVASQVQKYLNTDDDAGSDDSDGDDGGGLMDQAKGALGGLMGGGKD